MARDREKRRRREEEDEEVEESAGDIGKELEELESAWDESEVKEGFGDLPDDTYQAKITKAHLNHSKSSKRLQLTVEFTIATGKYKNRKKWSHYGLVDADSLGYVKGLFARLKLDPPKKLVSLQEEECLDQLVGQTCEISIKTRGDFQNVYVNKPIDLDDSVEDADDWEPSDRSKKSKGDSDDEPPKKKRREEEEDDDEPPKKKSRRDDDDSDDDADSDDDEKKAKRSDDDDSDDDKPAKKSKRDAEEDDDDEPPKKKARRDDDDDDDRPAKKKSKF